MGAQAKLFALELTKSSWTVVQLISPMFAFIVAIGAGRERRRQRERERHHGPGGHRYSAQRQQLRYVHEAESFASFVASE